MTSAADSVRRLRCGTSNRLPRMRVLNEVIVMEAGIKYRVTTDTGEVFTGTFNGSWPGSSGDGRSFLDVVVGDEASVRVDSMSLYISEIRTAEPVE